MNVRILRTELKRSLAPWAGVVALATASALLYLISEPWSDTPTAWTGQWTSMALWTRTLLFYLWPLAIGVGALQGLRDHRSKISDLLASTPRPTWHRAAAPAGTTAFALVAAFVSLILVGAVQVFAHTRYTHLGWLPISLVGALALVAGALLGMGAARALPSVLTPPALAMGAFVFTAVLARTETTAMPGAPGAEPNRLVLLSPAVEKVPNALVTLSASVHLGQTIWMLGVAATGFSLLVTATPRTRLLALAPVLAGAALALLVLPADPRRMFVVDEAAAKPVCDGSVCVSRAQQARLAGLVGPGKEALRLLHGALGGRAPVTVRENTTVQPDGATPRWSRTTVLFDFADDMFAAAKGEEMTRALIAQGMAPGCSPVGWNTFGGDQFAQTVAVGWVLGDLEPLPGSGSAAFNRAVVTRVRPVWDELTALPRAQQLARINAMRTAALSCEGDAFEVLKGGPSR
ncbi:MULTISPECIES: hypothetical protein [unclassified Streptomyces]|uniref:hypothetical protein n=1 Tax=unclassified Streptomyces TaxID=2593676 RepID=UPI000709BE03|nr:MULTISPECIES: hypothetical protein [unclassified Streptomyces]KRD23394.1 hypothetical protein ASE41_10520 [Streptomyces sp. Root264]